ncbi:MAG: carbohydrate ABC transporter substrate-binding protein [Clostridiales bacterium]|nr:carbohydrate ABC transporter substrate-binding protein [Clostridiales bacterium]
MKKVIAGLLSVAMIAAMAGCNKTPAQSTTGTTKAGESKPAETTAAPAETTTAETTAKATYGEGPVHINMWSFTNEVPNMAQKYIQLNPEFGKKYTIDVTIIATTNGSYQPALDAALKNGEVDMYAAEAAFILKYTKGDAAQFAAPYKDLGIDVDKAVKDAEIAQYTVDIGTRTSDSALVALGYQATGGAMIYRASIAKEVFGSDDAATVEKEVGGGSGNYDTFWKAAEKLKAKGYPIVSGDGDVWHMVENSSSSGWIVDGKLNISPERQAFFDISKKLVDNGWCNETSDWQPSWFADMKGLPQEGKDNKSAFCFFGPAWLINYSMKDNCGGKEAPADGNYAGNTFGDWRVCKAPAGFFWGGTWVLASKSAAENADKKAGVAELINWITLDASDKGLQYLWANGLFAPNDDGTPGTKDCVASGKVMATANGEVAFLGGQNMFPAFIAANANATGKNMTQYDETINSLFREQVNQYAHGQKSLDDAIKDFRARVADKVGEDGTL